MFEIVFLIALIFYFTVLVIFSIGASKKFNRLDGNKLPLASVIVAARNEELNILDCLDSLNKLEYPEGKLEVIIIDDHSTDKTYSIITEFIHDKPIFKVVQPAKEIGSLRGKANAIANGIEIASGEIILTTDADCSVSKTWAKTIASYFKDDVAMVCGYTNQFSKNIFEGAQSIDFIHLLTVAAGTMNLGKPISAIGNNMSYRKSVYQEVGGYEALEFSVTEDFNLLMAIHKLKKYKIIYPLDIGGLVTSKPMEDIKSLYWQKKRWSVGGLKSDIAGFSVMLLAYAPQICLLLSPFYFSKEVLYLIFFKLIIDFTFLKPIHSRLELQFSIKHFLGFQIYYFLYVLIMPPLVFLNRKVEWKGRKY
ncbi:MAG: glycosyltransferase [Melioribacteraceae bacterium]|nr:glycosyltransferase [Melioribacteraceae bacterium]